MGGKSYWLKIYIIIDQQLTASITSRAHDSKHCFLRVQVVISENRSYEECASPNLTKNVCKHKVRNFITKKLIC